MAVECRGGKMDLLFVGVIVVGIVALLFAIYLSFVVIRAEQGTPRMQEIAGFIHNGAMAFLKSEYKYLSIFAALVTVTLAFSINVETALAFVLGAMLSMLAGYFGMKIATQANVKTAQAARTSQKKGVDDCFLRWCGHGYVRGRSWDRWIWVFC
jgi:K(+)-stimulated pyrophosphate-energized sodium pump